MRSLLLVRAAPVGPVGNTSASPATGAPLLQLLASLQLWLVETSPPVQVSTGAAMDVSTTSLPAPPV